LGRVPGDPEFLAQFADLDPRITDQFQQDAEVGGVQAVQMITPVHFWHRGLTVLIKFSTKTEAPWSPLAHS
jgi:hypothetical protein